MDASPKAIFRLEKKLLHYTSKAIADFKMISSGDRLMVCLSGGKDSYTMLKLLLAWRAKSRRCFEILAFTLDQTQPGWNDEYMRAWLDERDINYVILKRDTYRVVKEKIPQGKTYCSLCSRLRRGHIYRYARDHGYNKIALGHHRDDLIQTLLMSMFYNGQISSMPPKLLTDDKRLLVIRPLAYCQERDIKQYARAQKFPLIPCNLCGSQSNLQRAKMATLLEDLAAKNPKIPSNILHAIGSVQPSQLMDHKLWDFKGLAAMENAEQSDGAEQVVQTGRAGTVEDTVHSEEEV